MSSRDAQTGPAVLADPRARRLAVVSSRSDCTLEKPSSPQASVLHSRELNNEIGGVDLDTSADRLWSVSRRGYAAGIFAPRTWSDGMPWLVCLETPSRGLTFSPFYQVTILMRSHSNSHGPSLRCPCLPLVLNCQERTSGGIGNR